MRPPGQAGVGGPSSPHTLQGIPYLFSPSVGGSLPRPAGTATTPLPTSLQQSHRGRRDFDSQSSVTGSDLKRLGPA